MHTAEVSKGLVTQNAYSMLLDEQGAGQGSSSSSSGKGI